jgi:hypothetical protein
MVKVSRKDRHKQNSRRYTLLRRALADVVAHRFDMPGGKAIIELYERVYTSELGVVFREHMEEQTVREIHYRRELNNHGYGLPAAVSEWMRLCDQLDRECRLGALKHW